ncbi:MAG: RHS repeat-associated core domain-containing protein, partial [Endozoicomonadaceae bacterium]|nr:RHS repeat-associated core domain-containing protein [Endozoicomonadaceae bacterium]
VMEKNINGLSYLFYCGNTLVNEKIINPEQDIHIIGYQGMAKTMDGVISEYYQSSYKGDIIGVFRKNYNGQYRFKQRNIYSPYGMVWHKKSKTLPLYQQTLQGFNGARTDPATGWQFLGNGNRTYNPTQHYFLSEDAAGDGYTFGSNNPVMNTDPSGNSSRWLGEAFKWAGYVSTLGLSALHQRWANITAAVIQTGCTIATLGAAVAGAGSAALAGVVTGAAAIGSIPVAAAAIPANKGLNLAGKIIGMAEMAVSVAAGALNLLPFSVSGQEAGAADIQTVKFPFRMLSIKSEISSGSDISAVNECAHLSGEKLATVQSFFEYVSSAIPAASTDVMIDLSILAPDDFLTFENEKEVSQAWLYLRGSSFKDNIECDTGTILLTYHFVNKRLLASDLADFLFVRNEHFYSNDIFSKSHPYFEALNKVLEPIQHTNRRYNLGDYSVRNLINALDRSGNCIIASGYNHIALIERRSENSVWCRFGVYNFFDKKGLDVLYYRSLNQFFYSSYHKKVIITGYMLIK